MVDEKKQRRCLGTLYHSQARLNANKPPLCAGVKSKVGKPVDGTKESVPAGDFKYMCLGYSVYEAEQRKAGVASSSNKGPPDSIELPFCEGLEVISAAELMKSPAVLSEGTAGASPSGVEGSKPIRPPRPQPGRSFVPGGSSGDTASEVASLKERYIRSSQKVLNKMGSNLSYMGRTAQQTVTAAGEFFRSRSKD